MSLPARAPAGRRALVLAGLLLALPLAGCLQDLDQASDDDGAGLVVDLPLIDFAKATVVDATRISGEPSIVVDQDGRIVVTGAGGMSRYALAPQDAATHFGQSYVWVSEDGGESWRHAGLDGTPVRFRNTATGVEGDLAVTSDNAVFFVDLIPGLLGVSTSRSEDGGRTWLDHNPATFPVPGSDRPWAAAGPNGEVYVTVNVVPTDTWLLKSTDGGSTFLEMGPMDQLGGTYKGGRLAVAPDGTIFVPGIFTGAGVSVSTDGGASFVNREVPLPADATFSANPIAVDAAGNLHFTYMLEEDGARTVWLVVSRDRGETWLDPVRVSDDVNGTAVFAHAVAGDSGRVAVVWYHTDAEGNPSELTDAAWTVRVGVTTNALDGADATFAVADATPEPMHEGAICTGVACNFMGSDRRLLDFFMSSVDLDGHVVVAYTTTTHDGTGNGYIGFVKQTGGPSLRASP